MVHYVDVQIVMMGPPVFAQLTEECPYTLEWAALPPKLPLLMGGSGRIITHDSLGPSESTT